MPVLPLIMTDQGLQPRAPADIRSELVANVAATNPDYTANLPGSLIEDIASTSVGAILESDSFLVDLVNSIAPNGANAYLTKLLGVLADIQPQAATNTSVYVTFTGPPGFVIVQGFTVSDGIYWYVCQDGGIIGTDGESLPIYAISPSSGSWSVPAGSVTMLITSVPLDIINAGFSVTNPTNGFPSTASETLESFRDRVLTAGLASSTGMTRYLKTLVMNIPGVIKRTVSVRQDIPSGRWVAMIGGGDPYQVAYALYYALFWVIGLIAAPLNIVNIQPFIWPTTPGSPPDPGLGPYSVITTETNHNLLAGMTNRLISEVNGTGYMDDINGQKFTVLLVVDVKNFVISFDSSGSTTSYIDGGNVTPNPVVENPTITDWPDHYIIPFVIPAVENVIAIITWTTDSPNYVNEVTMASAAGPALTDYINGIPAGTTPINFNVMRQIFLESTANIVPSESIIDLRFQFTINNISYDSYSGIQVINGDPNSCFVAELSNIVVQEAGQT